MEVTDFNINITSEQPAALFDWYRDVLELPLNERADGFIVGAAQLLIDGHSETKGRAKEPQRVLINMFVDDVEAERQRLLARGVEFVRQPEREPWGGVITTFLDLDGNYLQLIEFKPTG